jgi:hypothetical protein
MDIRSLIQESILLQEFNANNRREVLSKEEQFTVAYEIELEPGKNFDKGVTGEVLNGLAEIRISDEELLRDMSFVNFKPADLLNLFNQNIDHAAAQIISWLEQHGETTKAWLEDEQINLPKLQQNYQSFIRQYLNNDPFERDKRMKEIFSRESRLAYLRETYLPKLINRIRATVKNYTASQLFHVSFREIGDVIRQGGLPNSALSGKVFDQVINGVRRKMVTVAFPTFMQQYGSELHVKDDSTLSQGGVELAPKTYLHGLIAAETFLEVFFKDYEQQDIFTLNQKTGLHVNLGYTGGEANYNYLKGFFLLSETPKNGRIPKAFQGWAERMGSLYTGSYARRFAAMFVKDLKKQIQLGTMPPRYDPTQLVTYEQRMNAVLIDSAYSSGQGDANKAIGYNFQPQKSGEQTGKYIEFRFPGGNLRLDDLLEATYYYANLTLAGKDPAYRKTDYEHHLHRFLIAAYAEANPRIPQKDR